MKNKGGKPAEGRRRGRGHFGTGVRTGGRKGHKPLTTIYGTVMKSTHVKGLRGRTAGEGYFLSVFFISTCAVRPLAENPKRFGPGRQYAFGTRDQNV